MNNGLLQASFPGVKNHISGCFVPLTPPLLDGEPILAEFTGAGYLSVWFPFARETVRHCPSRLLAGKELRNA